MQFQILKRFVPFFFFFTLLLLEVIASRRCFMVHVRDLEQWCSKSDLKERLPFVHEPPQAGPNKETGRRRSSVARVYSAHWCPSPPAHQTFPFHYSQSGLCYL